MESSDHSPRSRSYCAHVEAAPPRPASCSRRWRPPPAIASGTIRRYRCNHGLCFQFRDRRCGIDAGVGAVDRPRAPFRAAARSEEHTSELQSLMRISYAVFCLKKKNTNIDNSQNVNLHTLTIHIVILPHTTLHHSTHTPVM